MMSLSLLQALFVVFVFFLFEYAGKNATTTLFVRVEYQFGNYSVDALLRQVV
jgi:hypothetical protein